ncbi:undecaprenyl/decaprenyl-phosphate alpha-N-acetylglucosaminyl 1-phosphate transferase [Pseudoflavonifractor sp. DSM 107456]|uniref:Undecaprenyl/decaprenyl-phosphate alpha-N-acetylglucosaminyl 1-phosphate transferase n=2 Tax=Pseudoflavonifractor TaxID=1017280 RepID=A0ABR9RF30_9FIRM|nr:MULTISPECIES: MraY family glycosyltransferase [Eubacteriales]MBC5732025.1 undecaprenyl/decaprenyl-phosphate alpha-N-acetylglucosaminyl 1-phosphate transferase [Pseudoflavonifractor hominis]MBE5057266.1 undecaprenyl/decaprenyl-phosphate alpha-N-acetylglucosaminyl 1-phosphate transferase [Pseudoflavonifractor gallinarum]MBT9684754.1 undecaprenyl/decaprenyl-phosphate alpha-N-acetylglucosaminyl 1-phosphate transferase [Pseudoflavonifractor sp. MCC625]
MPMSIETIGVVAGALITAFLVALITTPIVKSLAQKWGAVDVPKDGRRMHDHPIPRMGGLAIFLGFLLSVILFIPFVQTDGLGMQLQGMLLGAVIIVVLGILDDIYALPALPKLIVQIVAAVIAVCSGNVIETISNPNIFSNDLYWELGWLSIPVTVIWIVAVTNAVNLIDGLDGLACGVSTISSMTVLVIALTVAEPTVAVLMACLAGGCIGFLPYNTNPAKIFMGDTGSTFLGYVLAVVSIQGLFKYYTLISFVVPFLMLGLPIFDTCFAFIRRIAHGQSPMHADRSHIHHRLIDMGLNQKQAVAVLYVISAILGLSAVVLTTIGSLRAMLLLFAMCIAGSMSIMLVLRGGEKKPGGEPPAAPKKEDKEEQEENKK